MSVVLNIDNDHLDYYGSMGELKFAFKRFALMTHFMIFANADDKNTMDVMYTLDRRVRTFAIDNAADYRAVNVQEYKPGFFEFDLEGGIPMSWATSVWQCLAATTFTMHWPCVLSAALWA